MKHKDEVVTAETEDVRNNLELALTVSFKILICFAVSYFYLQ